jgi:hypothetical protein
VTIRQRLARLLAGLPCVRRECHHLTISRAQSALLGALAKNFDRPLPATASDAERAEAILDAWAEMERRAESAEQRADRAEAELRKLMSYALTAEVPQTMRPNAETIIRQLRAMRRFEA